MGRGLLDTMAAYQESFCRGSMPIDCPIHARQIHARQTIVLLLGPLLLASACRPKKAAIPETVEPIAHGCYEALLSPERTPQFQPSAPMEGGTFLILWTMIEAPEEYGSCTVDGSGQVLLLTSNATSQPDDSGEEPAEEPAEEQQEQAPTTPTQATDQGKGQTPETPPAQAPAASSE